MDTPGDDLGGGGGGGGIPPYVPSGPYGTSSYTDIADAWLSTLDPEEAQENMKKGLRQTSEELVDLIRYLVDLIKDDESPPDDTNDDEDGNMDPNK